jgi:hypothetical protein
MRKDIGNLVSQVAYGHERLVLRKGKRDFAAVISMEDLRLLEELERQADLDAYRKARKRHKKDGGRTVSLDEAFKDLES